MADMIFEKSINFLLENAGPVIRYRLHKEILNDLSEKNAKKLLNEIYNTQKFQLLKKYITPGGYIGIGMHSGDKYKETPLQDGEAAARLLSYYAIPKSNPIVANFIKTLRNEKILQSEFSLYKQIFVTFNNRFLGLRSGGGLMVLIYTMQALLGFGDDDEVREFQNISLEAFKSMLPLSSIADITKFKTNLKKKYNYPYIEEDAYLPCSYHLATLAYTGDWRTKENISIMADAINHINKIMDDNNNIHVKINDNYYCPLWALIRPIKAFSLEAVQHNYVMYRRVLTEIAMLGVGEKVSIIKESVKNVKEALSDDGVMRIKFDTAYTKKRYLDMLKYPTAYAEAGLEDDYKRKNALECDLTFWAIKFLKLVEDSKIEEIL